MNAIHERTDEHRRRLPACREKWKDVALTTESVDCKWVGVALMDQSRKIESKPPDQFLFFSSPATAWSDFTSWYPSIWRRLVAHWPYQLPIFDQQSYWRKFVEDRETVDLAIRRKAWPGEARKLLRQRNSVRGPTLGSSVRRELWEAFDKLFAVDWAWPTVRHLGVTFPQEHDHVIDQADRDDPSNPMDGFECIYLGPFSWLLHELACDGFCQVELGVRTWSLPDLRKGRRRSHIIGRKDG